MPICKRCNKETLEDVQRELDNMCPKCYKQVQIKKKTCIFLSTFFLEFGVIFLILVLANIIAPNELCKVLFDPNQSWYYWIPGFIGLGIIVVNIVLGLYFLKHLFGNDQITEERNV